MPKIPVISGKKLIKAVAKIGYYPIRQEGSHVQLGCKNKKTITIPLHREIGKGLIRKIMRDAEIDLTGLIALLD